LVHPTPPASWNSHGMLKRLQPMGEGKRNGGFLKRLQPMGEEKRNDGTL